MPPVPKPALFSGGVNGGSSGSSLKGASGVKRKTPSELRLRDYVR
ncbi:hypothetical protein Hanom_Chr03g00192891 [Helianthus anomalus]